MNQTAIGSYIARKRKEQNLTQEQLAVSSRMYRASRVTPCRIIPTRCVGKRQGDGASVRREGLQILRE